MLNVLTGPNTFQLTTELKRLVSAFTVEHTDMGLERLDGEEVEFGRIREALESLPFLASKKMVVLKNPAGNKEFAEKGVDLLKKLPETTDVVLVEPKFDKRIALYKFLKKNSEFKEFNELDENQLAKWLTQQATVQGLTFHTEDARYLVRRVGANQQLLSNELAKLLNYDPKITRRTIDLLTEATPQSTIFELLDAALAGNTKTALKLYEEQRAMKVEPQQIIAMLGWQLHVLAVVKTAGNRDPGAIAKEARINPFVVRKAQSLARNMPMVQVKKLVRDTMSLDIRLKSEPVDADEVLKNLLMSF